MSRETARALQVLEDFFGTSTKKVRGRGMAQALLDLIEAMRKIAEALQPITGRGVGYQLFVKKLIALMSRQ